MKKNFIILTSIFPILLFSQIGVNTANPKATFDVSGDPSNISKLDGIIPPRITGAELRAKTYTAEQTGAMVYVTAADTAPAGQTINVTRTGYFSFDGTVWTAISTPPLNLPNGTGTVIAINGEQQVALEISARMNTDWNIASTNTTPIRIANIIIEIIDNYNSFSNLASGNTFTVNSDGTYLVTMSFSVQGAAGGYSGNFYYGVYNETDNKWQSRLLETLELPYGAVSNLGFNIAMELSAGKTYSLRIQKEVPSALEIRGQLDGTPSTFFSVKRLK